MISPLPADFSRLWLSDEITLIQQLQAQANLPALDTPDYHELATQLLQASQQPSSHLLGIEALLGEYGLDNREGLLLMSMAEALLRIPDQHTRELFLRDRLALGNWHAHLGHSSSSFINMATRGMATAASITAQHDSHSTIARLLDRIGEPVILQATQHIISLLARQFVAGETLDDALTQAQGERQRGYDHSFDMLGEAALTDDDAEGFMDAYRNALIQLSCNDDHHDHTGISVKLSALSPRFSWQHDDALKHISARLLELVQIAATHQIPLTVDAEEAARLEPTLAIVSDMVSALPQGYQGFGLALQAYQKRAPRAIEFLDEICTRHRCHMQIRLVKGAYWDSEIRHAQQLGHRSYPVFTHKAHSDISYLACATKLFASDKLHADFASHNAATIAAIVALSRQYPQKIFGFQRLHGMGEQLYDNLLKHMPTLHCRIYAPVGKFTELLPYLVRRLLENGANSSFVHQMHHCDDSSLLALPSLHTESAIALPSDILPDRRNSSGECTENPLERQALESALKTARNTLNSLATVQTPAQPQEDTTALIQHLQHGFLRWNASTTDTRAAILERAAALFEQHRHELMALLIDEAGKTLGNAIGEVRETIDFALYYAQQCRDTLGTVQPPLPGPAGECNLRHYEGRGIFACISPWNFPLAIFAGQIMAALAAGNSVIAKPASLTPRIAARATDLLHQAGVPDDVLILRPCSGTAMTALLQHPAITGLAFTGSTHTAWHINRILAARDAPLATVIAETGGLNAMIVDSSALAEQVVRDVITSAFDSAGQRCSALRLLCLHSSIAPRVESLLAGAMQQLQVGDPALWNTDIGPVISSAAADDIRAYIRQLQQSATFIAATPLPEDIRQHPRFVAPHAFRLATAGELQEEIFGPVLHVLHWQENELDQLIDSINASAYGLTFGIHSRIEQRIQHISRRIRAGNIYINRSMIGAQVGQQPFGGMGLSGTGPKAGGPDYLRRFACEKVISENTAALGGDTLLLMQADSKAPGI